MWDPKCVFSFAANMEFVSSPDFLVQGENIWICDESLSSLFSTCYHPASEAFVLLCPSNSSLPPKVSHWKTTKLKALDSPVRTLTFTSGITIIENPFRHQVLLQASPRFCLGFGRFTQEKEWACHFVVTSADIHFAFCLCLHKGAGLLSVVKAWGVE